MPASSRATVAAQSSKLPPTMAAAARGASPDAHGVNATDIDFTAITLAGGGLLAYLSLTRLMGGVSLGKLSRAFASLRVVIDTAIDVDNWLRERPVGETPRLASWRATCRCCGIWKGKATSASW